MKHVQRAIMTVAAGLLTFLASTFAGEDTDRMAEYVSSSYLESASLAGIPSNKSTGERMSETVVATPKANTDADRWMKFEREFGIQTREPTWILGAIQNAKFELDKLTFNAKETARKLEFSYDLGRSTGPRGVPERATYSLPLFGNFGQPQLKSVITEHDPIVSKAFVGLQLRIPFGQGAAEYK